MKSSLEEQLKSLETEIEEDKSKLLVLSQEKEKQGEELSRNEQGVLSMQELNSKLNENLAEWQKANEVTQQAIIEAEAIYQTLGTNLIEWQNANKFIEDQILSLQQQNSNLNNELSNNSSSNKTELPKLYLDDQKEEVSSLKSIRNGNVNEISELQAKIDNLNMELESVYQKIESCDIEKRELQVANMDLLGQVDSLRIEKEEIEEEVVKLKSDLRSSSSQIDLLKSELDSLKEARHASNAEVAAMQKAVLDLEDKSAQYQKELLLAADQRSQIEESSAAKSHEIDALLAKISATSQESKRLQEVNQELNAENRQLRQEGESLKEENLILVLNKELEIKATGDNLRKEIEDLKCELMNLSKDNSKHEIKVESTLIKSEPETSSSDLEFTIADAQSINQALQDNLAQWQTANKSLEEMILNEQQLNPQFMQSLSEWQFANQEIQANIEKSRHENENLRPHHESLLGEVRAYTEKIQELELQRSALLSAIEKLQNEQVSIEQDLKDSKNQIDRIETLNKEIQSLKVLIDQGLIQINQLKKSNEVLQIDFEDKDRDLQLNVERLRVTEDEKRNLQIDNLDLLG